MQYGINTMHIIYRITRNKKTNHLYKKRSKYNILVYICLAVKYFSVFRLFHIMPLCPVKHAILFTMH
jgi:hypothetical protein